MATLKPIGRMHRKWLNDIANTKNGRMCIAGYEGTPWGYALDGLVKRGMLDFGCAFESGMAIYHITAAGREAIAEHGEG